MRRFEQGAAGPAANRRPGGAPQDACFCSSVDRSTSYHRSPLLGLDPSRLRLSCLCTRPASEPSSSLTQSATVLGRVLTLTPRCVAAFSGAVRGSSLTGLTLSVDLPSALAETLRMALDANAAAAQVCRPTKPKPKVREREEVTR